MPPRKRPPKASAPATLTLNGWTFLAWPAFDERWGNLIRAVADRRKAGPRGGRVSPEETVLAALVHVIRDHIARDPNDRRFRLRNDLAAWRRVKFLGRLRLFFRFSSAHRLVVLTWLNDEGSLRKEGSSTDPYGVFAAMLARGEIPVDWTSLVAESRRMESPLPDASRR